MGLEALSDRIYVPQSTAAKRKELIGGLLEESQTYGEGALAYGLRWVMQNAAMFPPTGDNSVRDIIGDIQGNVGLDPDGVVGPKTRKWAARYGVTLPAKLGNGKGSLAGLDGCGCKYGLGELSAGPVDTTWHVASALGAAIGALAVWFYTSTSSGLEKTRRTVRNDWEEAKKRSRKRVDRKYGKKR